MERVETVVGGQIAQQARELERVVADVAALHARVGSLIFGADDDDGKDGDIAVGGAEDDARGEGTEPAQSMEAHQGQDNRCADVFVASLSIASISHISLYFVFHDLCVCVSVYLCVCVC